MKGTKTTTESYFPFYHSILKATHILNQNTGEYEKFHNSQKLVFLYVMDRYKFFKEQGKEYFDNQEDIAIACSTARGTVFATLKLLQQCGYLNVRSKKSFAHRSNSYVFTDDICLAVINGQSAEWVHKMDVLQTSKMSKPKKPKFTPKPQIIEKDWDESDLPF